MPEGFPSPSDAAILKTSDLLAGVSSPLLIDGLALGALPPEVIAKLPPFIALCHHPLGFETGLDASHANMLLDTERYALAAAQHVITTSHSTGDALTGMLDVSHDVITVAEPGLDQADAAPRKGTPPVILSVGSLTPRKGHDLLISALAHITKLPWTCRIAGPVDRDPDWTRAIHAQIASHGLQDRVIILGPRSSAELAGDYHDADLFCLPSHYEGYGMVFAEAMMRGLPIIACRAGAVPEVVPNTAGLLAPPGNREVLADFLELLLTQPGIASQLSKGARAHAQTLPSWASTARIVRDVMKRRGA